MSLVVSDLFQTLILVDIFVTKLPLLVTISHVTLRIIFQYGQISLETKSQKMIIIPPLIYLVHMYYVFIVLSLELELI